MTRFYVWSALAGLLALQVLGLLLFGQSFIAASGHVLLWAGDPLSPDNSQQLADWYTLSHIIHGFIFYWLAGLFFPRLSIGARFVAALGVEVSWELLENTPWLIGHYREQALAVGYAGDSIINSVSDSCAMMLGFLFAWRLPVRATVALAVVLEAVALWAIRDSLVLNILNFMYPFEFITRWQTGL